MKIPKFTRLTKAEKARFIKRLDEIRPCSDALWYTDELDEPAANEQGFKPELTIVENRVESHAHPIE